MTEANWILAGIAVAISVMAGLALLGHMAAEKARVLARYEQLKAIAEYEDEMRRRRERARNSVARKVDLLQETQPVAAETDAG